MDSNASARHLLQGTFVVVMFAAAMTVMMLTHSRTTPSATPTMHSTTTATVDPSAIQQAVQDVAATAKSAALTSVQSHMEGSTFMIDTALYPKAENADLAVTLCIAADYSFSQAGVAAQNIIVTASDGGPLALTKSHVCQVHSRYEPS